MSSREIIRWVPKADRPETKAEEAAEEKKRLVKSAQEEARLAKAEAETEHARMMAAGRKLVRTTLEKALELADHPDFRGVLGPLEMRDIIKLAELVAKDLRLANGQATENVAIAMSNVDITVLSDKEQAAYRATLLKLGAKDE